MNRFSILVVFALTFFLLAGCDKDKVQQPDHKDSVINTLTFIRHDLSHITMGGIYRACCDTLTSGPGDEPGMVFKVFGADPSEAGWVLTIVLGSVTPETSYPLPTPSAGIAPVNLFIFDAATQNELNSASLGGTGSLYVHGIDCGPPVFVDITIDALVQSEFAQGPPVKVEGRIKATLVAPEDGPCD